MQETERQQNTLHTQRRKTHPRKNQPMTPLITQSQRRSLETRSSSHFVDPPVLQRELPSSTADWHLIARRDLEGKIPPTCLFRFSKPVDICNDLSVVTEMRYFRGRSRDRCYQTMTASAPSDSDSRCHQTMTRNANPGRAV